MSEYPDLCRSSRIFSYRLWFLLCLRFTDWSLEIPTPFFYLDSIIAGGGCFLFGLLLGYLYWCKVKEPFIASRFRKEFEKGVYGGKSFFEKPMYAYEGATVFLFAGTFFSIGNLLGIMIGICLWYLFKWLVMHFYLSGIYVNPS